MLILSSLLSLTVLSSEKTASKNECSILYALATIGPNAEDETLSNQAHLYQDIQNLQVEYNHNAISLLENRTNYLRENGESSFQNEIISSLESFIIDLKTAVVYYSSNQNYSEFFKENQQMNERLKNIFIDFCVEDLNQK